MKTPWDEMIDISSFEKNEASKLFMKKRDDQIFEYKISYCWPEKCRTESEASNFVFTSIGFYRSIGEFLMWNEGFSDKWSDFLLIEETKKERNSLRNEFLKNKYYNLKENNHQVNIEEDLQSHLISIQMNS
jgi:hypothetical protein